MAKAVLQNKESFALIGVLKPFLFIKIFVIGLVVSEIKTLKVKVYLHSLVFMDLFFFYIY